jgi:uncharacterized protein (DUF305 family)
MQMVEMARTQAAHRELRVLADDVIAAQGAKITCMQGWLR